MRQELGAGLLAGAAALLLFLGFALRRTNKRLAARLAFFVAGRPHGSSQLLSRRAHVLGLTAAAAQLTARVLPDKHIQRLRRKLIEAGYRSDRQLHIFLAAELVFTVMFGLAGFELLRFTPVGKQNSLLVMLLLIVTLALLGAYIPFTWLRRRAALRQRMILRALPDALDLMSISVTAGLSLDSAMAEVVQKWEGELSREFAQVLTEMQMGSSRRDALRNLADRNSLEDLRLIVAALLQADELGSNISDVLGAQADQMRVRRRQVAEEKARKAPVKMLVPIVVFIFPAMFVVVLAPAVIQVMGMFATFVRH
jgi:tight adherence protein C